MTTTDAAIDVEMRKRAQRALDRVNAMLAEDYAKYGPREPRYRHFAGPHQEMFCWTTEPFSDGRYAAFEYRPYGSGARTGKATKWRMAREIRFAHRNTAKARALKWYNAARKEAA